MFVVEAAGQVRPGALSPRAHTETSNSLTAREISTSRTLAHRLHRARRALRRSRTIVGRGQGDTQLFFAESAGRRFRRRCGSMARDGRTGAPQSGADPVRTRLAFVRGVPGRVGDDRHRSDCPAESRPSSCCRPFYCEPARPSGRVSWASGRCTCRTTNWRGEAHRSREL
jgi:hypothetical protein